ncbi:hypothetical protein PHYBOEH_004907 [Phytophthora boehmeriae]|uniref:PUB domain-containing protein n=1 Tax=Phytophthora boehmeriae TaxID=109152 RepID=A0A8T1XB45_9STRA|nr:hypothetical protein PHYBOEH_004907 [Phytophthora boehmeriae]
MEWLKKKKDEARQAAAKISNKRTAFRGDGNVLGGGEDSAAPNPPPPAARGPSIKMPFVASKQPPVSEEELQRRRELQQKALDQRGNAWEKRVATAREARQRQEGEREQRFQYTEPEPTAAAAAVSGPPPVVLSNDEVKVRELQRAHEQMGFNPYAATFSSSTQAVSAMNGIGSEAPRGTAPFPAIPTTEIPQNGVGSAENNSAVYMLLRQDPSRAISAAETLIKVLSNVVKNPQDDKFRKIRLSNAAIQSKLVAVLGAVDILTEAGFSKLELDGEEYLILAADVFQVERVQSAIDRVEVALIQLQHDST